MHSTPSAAPSTSIAEQALEYANPVIDRVARIGFAAKGMVAMMIGALALRVAAGRGGGLAGPGEALRELWRQPFGSITLGLVAVGLLAHAFWKLVQAFLDPERKGTGVTALAERIAFGVTAAGYLALALQAVRLIAGEAPPATADIDTLAERILAPPFGRWVVGLLGAIVMVSGVLQLRLAAVAGFRHILYTGISRAARWTVIAAGSAGYAALGVLSGLVGYSLVQVARQFDPKRADSWSDALELVAGVAGSPWPLAALAVGIFCYGLYFVLLVRFRRIH